LACSRVHFVRVQVRVLKIRTRVRLEYIAGLQYYINGKTAQFCIRSNAFDK